MFPEYGFSDSLLHPGIHNPTSEHAELFQHTDAMDRLLVALR